MDGSVDSNQAQPLVTVGSLYRLGRKLGSGSFGKIYYAINSQNGQEVAVKTEEQSGRHPMLLYEAKLLKHLEGGQGIAHVDYSGSEGGFNVMVMDLLGPSLEDLFSSCQRKFSVKSLMQLADQMITRLEYLHSKDFIHRDLKPDNFTIGLGSASNLVYLIDFGLAKRFCDSKGKHNPICQRKSLTGTARYASVNAHKGLEQSRRDDMEALGYILLYFSRGVLPWQGLQAETKEKKYQKIMEVKQSTSLETLCDGAPVPLATYVKYCQSLDFTERPDYSFLKRLFKDYMKDAGMQHDNVFEWSEREVGVRFTASEGGVRQRRSRRGASGREVSNSAAFQTEGRTSIRTFSRFTSPRDTKEFVTDGKGSTPPFPGAKGDEKTRSRPGLMASLFGCCRAQPED